MSDKKKEKEEAYWKQLAEEILEQEKRKEKKETDNHKRFETINRKIIAIHYLLMFLNCPIPANIQKPFHKLCIEIGRNKSLTIKKAKESQEWEISKEIGAVDSKKAEQWEKTLASLLEKIKQNSFLMDRIKNEPILLNIALQIEYDSWLEPIAELFEKLGIVLSAQELIDAVKELKAQKQEITAKMRTKSSPKKKSKKKPKKNKAKK